MSCQTRCACDKERGGGGRNRERTEERKRTHHRVDPPVGKHEVFAQGGELVQVVGALTTAKTLPGHATVMFFTATEELDIVNYQVNTCTSTS